MEYDTFSRRRPQDIHVLITVDTDGIMANYGPNRDPSFARTLNRDGTIAMCTDAHGKVHGQGSGQLCMQARVHDTVSVAVTSGSANAKDAVIIYRLDPPFESHVFAPSQAALYTRTRAGVVRTHADSRDQQGLSPVHNDAAFSQFSVTARTAGAAPLAFSFALYALSDDGQTQTLYGYYAYHFSVTVE
jgi:nematocidal protein AidA